VPIITEVGGIVNYGDITEGLTMEEQVDEVKKFGACASRIRSRQQAAKKVVNRLTFKI
jgi:hypothetical protein